MARDEKRLWPPTDEELRDRHWPFAASDDPLTLVSAGDPRCDLDQMLAERNVMCQLMREVDEWACSASTDAEESSRALFLKKWGRDLAMTCRARLRAVRREIA